MSRLVANVDIISESFEGWILKTNTLLDALSKEIVTANSTIGITGNTSIPRTAELVGTFGANTINVTNALAGGNVQAANVLTIVTNTVFSNSAVSGLNILVGNSTINAVSNSSSLLISNSVHRTLVTEGKLLVGNSTVNALANATLISIANSTSSANLDPIQLKTGITTVNTTVVSVGANVFANATSLHVGNSTYTSVVGNGSWTGSANLTITPTSYLLVSGALNVSSNASFQNTVNVTGLTTLSGNMNTPVANASTGVNVGANVNLTTTRINVGNSTVNTFVTSSAIETDGTLTVLGATSLANTLGVTGAANLASTLGVVGLTTLSGNMNTPTANASSAVNVGANVNLSTTKINVGNSTVNTYITSTAIETDGTLSVTGTTSLANTLGVTGAASFSNTVTFQSDYVVDVSANSDVGTGTGSSNQKLIYSFPTGTYDGGKFEIKIENGGVIQVSELLLAQNGSSVSITTYGSVSSNGTPSALGTFSANINSTTARLYLNQTTANSSVKIAAHLIK